MDKSKIKASHPFWFTLAALLAILAPAPARADAASQTASGQILVWSVPSTGVRPARAMGQVNAPAELVRQIISDFKSYQTFVPRVIGSRRIADNRFIIESEFPWPVNRTWVYVSVRSGEVGGSYVVEWKMINGTLQAYQGVAWIKPQGNRACLLTYQMLAVPHTAAPNALVSYGLRKAASGMVKALQNEAIKRLGQPPAVGAAAGQRSAL